MEDDWESENFVPAAPGATKDKPKNMWDDEDVEEEDVKESWEDDDKPPEPKPVPANVTVANTENKANDTKRKHINMTDKNVAEKQKTSVELQDEKLADPLAEKLRQQRLVEEADYEHTTELFGKPSGQKSLDSFIPKSEDDFREYAELIAQKLRPYEKSYHYMTLIKAVMRHGMFSLKAADAKEVASTATVIANEKIKAEKDSNAGKKKGGAKKKQIHVDREEDDAYVGAYDDANDYDFM